jgi:hypothetical protein
MTNEIGGENFINSDSILERITELENQAPDGDESEISSELDELRDIVSEARLEDRCAVFIRESYFAEAMEEDAYDFGFVQRNSPVVDHVDWDAYADCAMIDYQEYSIAGYTYYARG